MSKAKKERDAFKRQQEILFDLSFDLGSRFAQLEDGLDDMINDHVGASRGLLDRVKIWTVEFDAAWEMLDDDEKGDYLGDIDIFFESKFDALVKEVEAGQANHVVSIQVVPIIEEGDIVTPQFQGPTERTTGWGVYKRSRNGTTRWFADTANELDAMFIGSHVARGLGVDIETQPWVKS